MNDDLRNRITRIFERVEGGSTTDMWSMIDAAIDDGEITQEEWQDNEMAICHLFDDRWFTCVQCGWTQPICQLSPNDHDEMVCDDCSPEEDE